MARINKVSITLCALLFTSLSITPLAHASEQARSSASQKSHQAKSKKKTTGNKTKTTAKASSKKKTSTLKAKTPAQTKRTASTSKTAATRRTHSPALKTASAKMAKKCSVHKGRKKCTTEEVKPLSIADAHKGRVQKAQKTAMNKLMGQIGKPYRWGGTSPRTGFDCSGLVYYAYKDLVKIRIPRTANEMYHLRDARAIDRGELQSGDLVFFRTRGRGTADHVGVYVGNGKFIQSPRSGRDIQITSLSEDYWANHYVGARRVMTPKTIR